MRAMRRVVAFLVVLAACSSEPVPAPETRTAPAPVAKAPEPAKAQADPVVLRICEAFVDVHEHNKTAGDDKILQRTAARALQLGVNEGQIDAFGPTPPQMLDSIRKRGNPPECKALVAYLEQQG